MTANLHSSKPDRNWGQRFRDEIVDSIDQQMDAVFDLLPEAYFESLSEDDQVAHLKALMAVRICDLTQEIMLRSRDGQRLTIISHQNYAGFLAELIQRLPDDRELVGAQIFSSRDKRFLIDIFEFKSNDPGREVTDSLGDGDPKLVQSVAGLTGVTEELVREFLSHYHPRNPILKAPEEIAKQYAALSETQTTRDLTVIWEVRSNRETRPEKRYAKVIISSVNATTRSVFQRTAAFFARYSIDVERAFCEQISKGENANVAMLTFHVCIENEAFDVIRSRFGEDCSDVLDGDVLREKLIAYLRLDEEVVSKGILGDVSMVDHFGDSRRAELFCGLARLTHFAVMFRHGLDVSRETVFRRLIRIASIPGMLVEFENRFLGHPPNDALTSETDLASISDLKDRLIVQTFRNLTRQIQRTNLMLGRRRALAFRFAGDLVANPERGEPAFAVFYVYGQGFDGFHLRFRDVARGGLRIVPTRNTEHYLFESSRIFDEVYRLASAQHLKNKDIAEGGAKAVVVLKPGTHAERAGRDFVDSLLDLVTQTESVRPVGRPQESQEYLYLGPDENVTNRLIEWIVDRAEQRGYPLPATLMSSKPLTGINHKEFGVTSEGVVVFLHRALLENGIDPHRQSFTIKMTGGPDGDVGGNSIRILIREYGKHVNFVGIADGSGAAADPDGLSHEELLRLVNSGLGIAAFDLQQLGTKGRVVGLNDAAEIAWRNNLHFHQPADVFVPAGGRPSAINENNWEDYLDVTGQPSARIIVEGANLFITESARQKLSECGVTIIKDSSANKCGVICSSLEIIAGMILTAAEFQEIKSAYVSEVLSLLKSIARIEATSLFNEYARQASRTLPEVSVELSQQIIRVADVIRESFVRWSDREVELADEFIFEFLPASLVAKSGRELVLRIPQIYRQQLTAAILSSRIVYREGYRNVQELTPAKLESLVRQQLIYEQQIREIVKRLKDSDLPDRDRIILILDHAGARAQRELKL